MNGVEDPDVETWSRDWRRLRHQKHRKQGGVEAGMLLDYLLYEGEHQSIQVQNAVLTRAFKHTRDKNKLRLVIPLARRLADRKIGRHWSIAHSFRATPNTRDPLAYDLADVVGDQLIPALDQKLQQSALRWLIAKYVTICGVCFEHVDWKDGVTQDVMPKYDEEGGEMLWKDNLSGAEIPESQLELLLQSGRVAPERFQPAVEVTAEGEVGADIYDPFRTFIDASVPTVKALGPDQAIYLADIRSLEWVTETFGSDHGVKAMQNLSIAETELMDRGIPVSGVNLKDLLPLVQGSKGKDDPDCAIVLTRYQPASKTNPYGIRSFLVPDQVVLDKGEIPYPEVPVIDYHWSAPGSTMWTTGFVRDLQSLSKFINKRFSQLGEAANSQLYEMLLLGGGLGAKDIPSDFPGVVNTGINDETGMPNVQVVPRGQLPAFFPESIRLSMETLDMLGSSDLMSQRKFPGQIRGPLAIPMLQEILDSEDGPRFSHWAEQFALEKGMRVNRVKQFYPPIRTLNYTGEDLRHEVLEFHADEVLRAGIDFTISIDPGSIMPELSMMREARVRERFQWAPGLYVNPRTQQPDWSKLAKDLKYNDRQREGSAVQGRKLARQLVRWARNGKLTLQEIPSPDPAMMGQMIPQLFMESGEPFILAPFYSHDDMMDEYVQEMQTTEFLEASTVYRRVMYTLYDMSRKVLGDMQAARQKSVENKMVQGAMAQASQQAAAKAAATAADAAIEQIMMQKDELPGGSGFEQLQAQVRQLMGGAQGQQPQQQPQLQAGPARRQLRPGQ